MLCTQVNPETFIDLDEKLPVFGRESWTDQGKANGLWNYGYIVGKPKIGNNASGSLNAWSTCAGSLGYERILMHEGYLRDLGDNELGLYGPDCTAAVKAMQTERTDPATGLKLEVDGTIGMSDSRALVTPILDAVEMKYKIPNHLLRGETNLESGRMDLGALGWTIWYGADQHFGGVDRSVSQINSKAHKDISWLDAYNPYFSIDWSGEYMRSAFDDYRRQFPDQRTAVLWDAALCHHNNPSAALAWARDGFPPSKQAADYVFFAKAARY